VDSIAASVRRQIVLRLAALLALVGLLAAPLVSCTSRGTAGARRVEYTGVEVLSNRSRQVDEWVAVAEWSVQVGTNMARAHPGIGHEGPDANVLTLEDVRKVKPIDRVPPIPSVPVGESHLFRGRDQGLRALFAGVLLVTLLGAVFARRPIFVLAMGALAAAMFVTFLDRSEAMVRRLMGSPDEGLEISWEFGAYLALAGFAGMAWTGFSLWRSRHGTRPGG
jgi:hypothetical protein